MTTRNKKPATTARKANAVATTVEQAVSLIYEGFNHYAHEKVDVEKALETVKQRDKGLWAELYELAQQCRDLSADTDKTPLELWDTAWARLKEDIRVNKGNIAIKLDCPVLKKLSAEEKAVIAEDPTVKFYTVGNKIGAPVSEVRGTIVLGIATIATIDTSGGKDPKKAVRKPRTVSDVRDDVNERKAELEKTALVKAAKSSSSGPEKAEARLKLAKMDVDKAMTKIAGIIGLVKNAGIQTDIEAITDHLGKLLVLIRACRDEAGARQKSGEAVTMGQIMANAIKLPAPEAVAPTAAKATAAKKPAAKKVA